MRLPARCGTPSCGHPASRYRQTSPKSLLSSCLVGDVSYNFPTAVRLFAEYVHSGLLRDDLSRQVNPRYFERPYQSNDRQIARNDNFLDRQRVAVSFKNRATYSMTASAPASRTLGTVRPRSLAVLRLITSSNFVGAWTGRSAGFAPRRMRLTYPEARLKRSTASTP
jgi:hypothetical protein